MSELNKKEIEVEGANVPFFTYQDGEDQVFEFDTSKCGPPDPMVNAMAGLKLVDAPNKKLVMINHKSPGGLIAKIGENYDIVEDKIDGGLVKLTFSYKSGDSEKADLSDNTCG
ncbi:hypothetical protein MNB_SV-5-922 [hydrothermal vent metagenome]|uniref:Uncharacterized protein n=1 Tax=hydrothermal vent metagenome TaxID=652676 RepID=A0A1W1EG74_9ZZZZ